MNVCRLSCFVQKHAFCTNSGMDENNIEACMIPITPALYIDSSCRVFDICLCLCYYGGGVFLALPRGGGGWWKYPTLQLFLHLFSCLVSSILKEGEIILATRDY